MSDSISSQATFPYTEDLAFIFGVLFGDADLSKKENTYQFRFKSIDIDFIESVKKKLFVITGKKAGVYSYEDRTRYGKKKLFNLILSHKNFVTWLNLVTLEKTLIPQFVFDADNRCKLEFLRGLMDSDGWISKSKKGYFQIGFAKTKEDIVEAVILLATKLGIRTGKVSQKLYPSGKYLFSVLFKNQNFICPFSIIRKQKRFRDYVRSTLEGKDIVQSS